MPAKTKRSPLDHTSRMLHELHFSAHRVGYKQLCLAIPKYAQDDTQGLSKVIYPQVAQELAYADWRAVEHSIRDAIEDAWDRRDPEIWKTYFPGCEKAPSNKLFIATLAERIKF